jgi:hypothetical protein
MDTSASICLLLFLHQNVFVLTVKIYSIVIDADLTGGVWPLSHVRGGHFQNL